MSALFCASMSVTSQPFSCLCWLAQFSASLWHVQQCNAVQHFKIMHLTTLHLNAVQCRAPQCSVVYCTIIQCNMIQCNALRCTVSNASKFKYFTKLFVITLSCTALYYISFHCTVVHITALYCLAVVYIGAQFSS